MVELVWTESALMDLDEVAEYIALDNPLAASSYVKKVFKCVDRLGDYPNSGKRPTELPDSPYREVVVPPCRVFYRIEDNRVYIVHVMRSERLLRTFLLGRTDRS
ncbi:MAG: type II toxin-antitoxin system RelE/ParE family toxin [Kiritimatiellae bacterium]|nr:type II toxin-antitoxin system RelE/ParE family toxin [Kiritimatiellia bacterium]